MGGIVETIQGSGDKKEVVVNWAISVNLHREGGICWMLGVHSSTKFSSLQIY